MKIDIITLFPEMFKGPFDDSMVKAAKLKGLVEIDIHNLRNWTEDKHKTTDDRSFGGGKGMIIKIEPVYKALNELLPAQAGKSQKAKGKSVNKKSKVILFTPQGKTFNQKKALELSKLEHLILLAGHYEGFDERIHKHLVNEEISIGDYVLTGGEIPAMVLVDTIVRLIPGVLSPEAKQNESFSLIADGRQPTAVLDYPHYTRPEKFLGWSVPKVLLSGNHKEIEKFRLEKALEKTKSNRPDLLVTQKNSD